MVNRRAQIGDIAFAVRQLLQRRFIVVIVIAAIEYAYLQFNSDAGAPAFALIAVSSCIAIVAWSRIGTGLPLFPLLIFQNLVTYALPIATHNETIVPYPGSVLTAGGWEVFLFNFAMLGGWRLGMQAIHPSSSLSYALEGLDDSSPRLARLGMIMIVTTTAYALLGSLRLLDPILALLPTGSDSILHVLTAAISACGFFLTAMMLGRNTFNRTARAAFWVMLAVQCIIAASAFLLSTTITVVFSVIIGLFWGTGKVPWRFLTIVTLILAFLNLGKFTMRDRYWLKGEGNPTPDFALAEMPHYYTEWVEASWDTMVSGGVSVSPTASFEGLSEKDLTKDTGQSLLDRINNLQNLLYVIDVMHRTKVQPLGGGSYSLIIPLLVPRIIWPNKPRSHEGQVLLNVHFGRQALESTFTTYIAWGLLPEAYGNFGPITGAILIGAFLGLACAWGERFTAKKLVLSTEGFLAFTIFLGMANSFEMVASVLITSLFQACIPIALACAPFVRRMSANPTPAGASSPKETG